MSVTSNTFTVSVEEPAPPPPGAPAYLTGMADYEVKRLTTAEAGQGYASLNALYNDNLNWDSSNPIPGTNEPVTGIIADWTGGAEDPDNHALYYSGGGHQGEAWNGIVRVDFNGDATYNGQFLEAGSLSERNFVAANNPQGSSYTLYADGRPSSRHTYNNMRYNSVGDEIWFVGGAAWHQGGQPADWYKFDRGSGQYLHNPGGAPGGETWPDPQIGATKSCWDKATRKQFVMNRALNFDTGFLDSDAETVSAGASLPYATADDEKVFLYDQRRKIVRYFSLSDGWVWAEIDWTNYTFPTNGTWTPTGTGLEVFNSGGQSVHFDQHPTDPSLDRFWIFGGQANAPNQGGSGPDWGWSNIVEMNATTFVCQNHSLLGDDLTGSDINPGAGIGENGSGGYQIHNGNYNRAVWMPDWQCVGTVVDDDYAYVIKLPLWYEAPPPPPTGSLLIERNGRYLQRSTGEPFIVNGDTAWTLVNSLSKADITTYFADCQAKGINSVMWEMIQNVAYSPSSANAPLNAEGNAPFGATNFVDMLEPYWAHVDWIVAEAATYDIVLFSYPAYMEQSGEWQDSITAAGTSVMAAYGTWIGARYKDADNIIWVGGGDFNAAGALYTNHNAMWDALVLEDTRHLVTAHAARENSGIEIYNEPWLTLNSTYSNLDTTLSETQDDWNKVSVLGLPPMFYLEGEYIPRMSDQQARYQAYTHIFGGGTGHFYGDDEIWGFIDWQTALDREARASLQYLDALFASRPVFDIDPDYTREVIVSGFGGPEPFLVFGCQSNGGDTFMAYFPSNGYTITVAMVLLGGTDTTFYWYNVRDGSSILDGTYANSGPRQFTPPGSGDWVLVGDNAALGAGPPGT